MKNKTEELFSLRRTDNYQWVLMEKQARIMKIPISNKGFIGKLFSNFLKTDVSVNLASSFSRVPSLTILNLEKRKDNLPKLKFRFWYFRINNFIWTSFFSLSWPTPLSTKLYLLLLLLLLNSWLPNRNYTIHNKNMPVDKVFSLHVRL